MADIDSPGPVADALSGLYRSLHQAIELGIRQEMRFLVKYRYHGLVRLYHCLLMGEHGAAGRDEHGHGHDSLKHLLSCVLHRIEHMGADADSSLDGVAPTDDVRPALEAMVAALESAYAAADAVADAAEAAKDRPAFALAADATKALDCHVERLRAELNRVADMGQLYLAVAATA
jgi:hypothetical protein